MFVSGKTCGDFCGEEKITEEVHSDSCNEIMRGKDATLRGIANMT